MRIFRDINTLPEFKNGVATIGSFDGVHLGHRQLIRRIVQMAREIDGESIMITFHPHPRAIIDPENVKLLTTLEEKIQILKTLKVDNLVVVPFDLSFSQQPPEQYIEDFLIKKINPKGLVIGYDHRFGKDRRGDINLLFDYQSHFPQGIKEISKKEIQNIAISSSKVRNYLQDGQIEEANSLLDYYYMLTGTVVSGDKIGREIGYPTANIKINSSQKLIPSTGIYAARAQVDGSVYNGMLYIGTRPTVDDTETTKIEINLFDFDQNIYDKEMTISIYAFIREDMHLDSLDALQVQLGKDKRAALEYFSQLDSYSRKEVSKVAIAILSYNSRERLESFLPSVSESLGDKFETYVIDNASDDDTVEFVQEWFPEIHTIQFGSNYGYAKGYNKAIEQIDSKYLVLLNDDVMVTPNWLSPIIKLMEEDASIGACMPSILDYELKTHYEYAGAAGGLIDKYGVPYCKGRIFDQIERVNPDYNSEEEVFWASGAAIVVRSDMFINLEGFDESFFAHQEEIDLCWRMKNAGYKVMSVPQSIVYHVGGSSLAYDNPKKTYLNVRNNHWMIIKNHQDSNLLSILLPRIIQDKLGAVYLMLTGHFKKGIAVFKGLTHAYLSIGKKLTKRKQIKHLVNKYAIGTRNMIGKSRFSITYRYYVRNQRTVEKLNS
jgi:riboflavin kinase/FMN adenylyltransferase